ncbi:FAD:protein FMN transferase [Qipengyuania sp. RANM35]|uniref:FAD:protein FMN transferase n=1 Tax=Qipengyuania sp. RANM35 TaxID=3068635 RepID=UPI0034DB14D6
MLPDAKARRCRPLLGTYVEIEAEGDASVIDAGFEAIAEVHRRMSFHEQTSDLARMRDTPIGSIVHVSRLTVETLTIALDLYRMSDGLFDVSVGRELVRDRFLPMTKCGWKHAVGELPDLEILDECSVVLRRPLLIDLGGIAKGFAVDRAVAAMQAAGCNQGIVNAGGDLRTFGDQAAAITMRNADGTLGEIVPLVNSAMASSSNLHNRRRRWGISRSPHRGPHGRSILSNERVTVIAPRCVIADAMTKVALVDRQLAKDLLAAHGGIILESDMSRAAA